MEGMSVLKSFCKDNKRMEERSTCTKYKDVSKRGMTLTVVSLKIWRQKQKVATNVRAMSRLVSR